MSHNKRKQMKQALAHLDQILRIHRNDGDALPGSAVEHVQEAKKIIVKDKMMTPRWQEKSNV